MLCLHFSRWPAKYNCMYMYSVMMYLCIYHQTTVVFLHTIEAWLETSHYCPSDLHSFFLP
ncbi:hypothetical protein BDV09DRAFT_166594 [Aspergillus tetrazonus]